jgi:transposase
MSIMETMERKQPRARQSFTPEFRAEIVELCQRGDRSIGQVARDFDLTETAVREWVRQAERDAGTRGDGGLTSAERQELSALRRENRRLRQDVEILKRATAHVGDRCQALETKRLGGLVAGAVVAAGCYSPTNEPSGAMMKSSVSGWKALQPPSSMLASTRRCLDRLSSQKASTSSW